MSGVALTCTLFYLLLRHPNLDICTEKLVFNAYLSSWLPSSVCLPIKTCHEAFVTEQLFFHIYRKYSMSMWQNFRSKNIAEMSFLQSVQKPFILSTNSFHHLIRKISWGCHELNIFISMVTWQCYKSGWKLLYWKICQHFVWNNISLSSQNLLVFFFWWCRWRF